MAEWSVIIKGIHSLQERYDNGEIPFEQMRDGVVKILRTKLARYLREPNWDMDLEAIIDELAEVDSDSYYDRVKNELYDWCDDHKVWLDPIE